MVAFRIVSRRRTLSAFQHGLAAAVALSYAWFISTTNYVTTAVQFVSPLAIIVVVHTLWRGVFGGYAPGFAQIVLHRSVKTALIIAVGVAVLALFAPMPAEANSKIEEVIGALLFTVFCLAIVAFVLFIVGLVIYGLYRLFASLFGIGRKTKPPPYNKVNDVASLALVLVSVVGLSLEGTAPVFTFSADESALSSFTVKADPTQVWQAAAVATSPDFPLPSLLRSIPQPVKILIDEGVDLNARRVVLISGREGSGELSMRIVRKTDTEAVFEVVGDTSPVAIWVTARSLAFRIEPIADGTKLTVFSTYDRLLAPAWFFRPFMGIAAHMAVDTLARDIRRRAEISQVRSSLN
jgi:hypothetical protein